MNFHPHTSHPEKRALLNLTQQNHTKTASQNKKILTEKICITVLYVTQIWGTRGFANWAFTPTVFLLNENLFATQWMCATSTFHFLLNISLLSHKWIFCTCICLIVTFWSNTPMFSRMVSILKIIQEFCSSVLSLALSRWCSTSIAFAGRLSLVTNWLRCKHLLVSKWKVAKPLDIPKYVLHWKLFYAEMNMLVKHYENCSTLLISML